MPWHQPKHCYTLRENHPIRVFINFDPLHFGVAFNHGKNHFVARNRGPAMSWLQGSKETWRCGASEGGCCLSVNPTYATYYDFELFLGEKHQTRRRNLVNKVSNDIFLSYTFLSCQDLAKHFSASLFWGYMIKTVPLKWLNWIFLPQWCFSKENEFSQTLGCIFLGDFRGAKNLEVNFRFLRAHQLLQKELWRWRGWEE